ncbi:MAG: translocation/assembly module TamB domain-containing protein, partial [Bacteroidota bacterium]
QQTLFKGNFGLTGLPNIEETYFDILADQVTTNRHDIQSIPVYPFDSASHVRIPESFEKLGKVNFKGKFSGFYNDFVAYGNVNTALGYVSSDINLKFNPNLKREFYKGHLSAREFNIGKFIGVSDLGALSLSSDVDGSGLRLNNMETQMKGAVSLLQYKGYDYHNITVNGQISKKLFDGTLVIDEPNIDLKFNGQVDFQEDIPVFDFTADVNRLRLDKLNLVKLPGESEISSQLEINFSGNRPDNWEGEIQVNNFNYKAEKVLYHINNISMSSDLETSTRGIHIKSDFVDGDMKGQFEFKALPNALMQLLPEYLPAFMPDLKKISSNQNFDYDIHLKNTSLITEIFLPSWKIDPSTIISGNFNSNIKKFECNITSDEISYKNFRLQNEKLSLDAGSDVVSVRSIADRIYYSDSAFMETPALAASAKMNEVDFILQLADSSGYANRGYFNGSFETESPTQFNLKFHQADITLNNKPWKMNPQNSLRIDSSAFIFNAFSFASEEASMGLQGTVSENEMDTLFFKAENFSLADLNAVLKKYSVNTGGVLNGTASISNLYKKPLLLADLSVRSLAVNNDTLGNAIIVSRYDSRKKAVHLSMNVLKNEYKTIFIDGDYYLSRENDNLDFDIKLTNFYVAPYERYMAGVVSKVKGKLTADLKLTGTFSKPNLNGTLDLGKASCLVNYLNTIYSVNDRVYVKENYFEFKDFVIRDINGNIGKANGYIRHNYFSDFRFDVRLDVEKFEGLNTNAAQNEMYYGNAFVTGYARFVGPVESMNMDMQLKSEKGTEMYIPLTSASELTRSNYITFINRKDSTAIIGEERNFNPAGVTLDMRFEVTTDASIEIIFDEKIGDKIKGIGTGNLRFTLDEGGSFNIYGNYYISKGDYLFTLQNIINKRFTIDNGAINWNGDPYNADINLTAFYKGGTSTLYKVMPEDSSLRRRLNYEVVLNLTNKLMNPTINYEIKVTGLDNATASTAYSRLNSEAELTRQVFGLMLLNQFLPRQNGTQQVEGISAAAGAGSSATELLSNQVSNWLSQLSTDVNLGFNYRAGDTYNKEEIELMFSKTLFNDRLSIEGNVGVASDQSTRNIVGDFNAEYALTLDARLKLKAFNRSNVNNVLDYNSPYTQGVGIFYHEQFNSWKELWNRHRRVKKEEEKPATPVSGTAPTE